MRSHLKNHLDQLGIDSSKDEFTSTEVEEIVQSMAKKINETNLKKVRKLSSNDKMVHAVVHALPGPIYWISSDLKFIGLNNHVPRSEGDDLAALIGQDIGTRKCDDYLNPIMKSFFESEESSYSWDAKILTDGTPQWFQMVASKYNKSKAAVVVGIDITSRRELVEKLRLSEEKTKSVLVKMNNSNTRLSYAQKMEALGEMADAIAHEINNPLAIINGRASLMLDYLEQGDCDESKFKVFIGSICSTAQRIAKIVGSLRAFASTSESDVTGVHRLQEIVKRSIDECSEDLKKAKITFKLQGMQQNSMAECRPKQIEQVVINFIKNSCYAIKDLDDPWIEIALVETDLDLRIEITDSGNGISKELTLKIFQPFFTTKDIGQGTGLGLSVSKGVIDDHGGTIGLDFSCPNTRFIITIPRAKKSEDEIDLSDAGKIAG